LVDLFELLD